MTGKLFNYLKEIDIKAQNELDRLIPILAKQQGVTEELKAKNQLKWIGLMNNIKTQADEFVLRDFVYSMEGRR